VIGAFLTGAFSKALAKGRAVRCESNLRQIGIACFAYAADHDSRLPQSYDSQSGKNGIGVLEDGGYLPAKTGSANVEFCPEDWLRNRGNYHGIYKPGGSVSLRTYAMNAYIGPANGTYLVRLQAIARPDKILLAGDGIFRSGAGYWNAVIWGSDQWQSQQEPPALHGKGVNLLFLDGHVENRAFSEIPRSSSGGGLFWKGVNP